jgi:hypothetical protein
MATERDKIPWEEEQQQPGKSLKPLQREKILYATYAPLKSRPNDKDRSTWHLTVGDWAHHKPVPYEEAKTRGLIDAIPKGAVCFKDGKEIHHCNVYKYALEYVVGPETLEGLKDVKSSEEIRAFIDNVMKKRGELTPSEFRKQLIRGH